MLVCYFLGNGFKFDAKIDKNTCIKQIKPTFFRFNPEFEKMYLNMKRPIFMLRNLYAQFS